ncbi:MAG: hypothetical protein AAF728_12630 [Cyanobacteria bacterium P01_D01_bin.128]
MASQPRKRSPRLRWPRPKPRTRSGPTIPWRAMALCVIVYAFMGLFLASFPAPYWVWNLALGGTVLQTVTLAGPRALGRMRWLPANFLALLSIIGTGLIVVALAIAMNFRAPAALDEIEIQSALLDTSLIALVAIATAAVGACTSAAVGDRMLAVFKRFQVILLLAALCILGLGLGGLTGITLVAE